MDHIDNEELAFCEESGLEKALEDETDIFQTVFDEEDAISNENIKGTSMPTTMKEFMSRYDNSKKNSGRRYPTNIKREAWIVNPRLRAARKQTLKEEFDPAKFHEILPDNHIDLKYSSGEVGNEFKNSEVAGELSCEHELVFNASTKIQSNLTSNKHEINIKNSNTNNNLCNICGKFFLTKSFFKDDTENRKCSEKSVWDCKLCIEKFAKRSFPEASLKLDKSKPDDFLQCNLCGLNFNQTNNLQEHLRTMHFLQLREILKNCFHVETRNDLKGDSLIVQVLPEGLKIKAERVSKCESDEQAKVVLDLPVKNELKTEKEGDK